MKKIPVYIASLIALSLSFTELTKAQPTLTVINTFPPTYFSNGNIIQQESDSLAGLVLAPDGNFYGTTENGFTSIIFYNETLGREDYTELPGNGSIFKVSSNGALSVLHFISATNEGSSPYGHLTRGADGNYYGTTLWGAQTQGYAGSIFEITTNGDYSTIYSFPPESSTNDTGAHPYSYLTLGGDGCFYGTTAYGGTNENGTIFKMTPDGTTTAIHTFGYDYHDGYQPQSGLISAPDSTLYGTVTRGGLYGGGTLYKMTTNGNFTILFSFGELGNAGPGALTWGQDGNIYGTTEYGYTGGGTIFKCTTNGVLTTLFTFGIGFDGDTNYTGSEPMPTAPLVQGSDGKLYGTAAYGGAGGSGTLFSVSTNGTFTLLYSFSPLLEAPPHASFAQYNSDGAVPAAEMAFGPDGNLYGTTSEGGPYNNGTIFKLVVPPSMGAVSFSNGVPQISLCGLARPLVQIQSSTDLLNWSTITNLVFTNGSAQFMDFSATNSVCHFYRAAVQ